jgi:hypothetical protein
MGALTEIEIFSKMTECLRLAAGYCDQLAIDPFKGFVYEKLREELALIEGCCKQASAWREDTRWLYIGLTMAKIHQQAGDWLRGPKINGVRLKLNEREKNMNFVALGEYMRQLYKIADELKNKAPPKLGMIVPEPVKPFMRDVSEKKYQVKLPASLAKTKGGLLVPKQAVKA